MKFDSILVHCTEVIKVILKSKQPPDLIIKAFFNKKKYIGSKERKIISEIVFMHLRFIGFTECVFNLIVQGKRLKQSINDEFFKILLSILVNIILYPNNLVTICKNIEKLYSLNNGFEFLQNYIIEQINLNFNFEAIKKIILHFEKKDFKATNVIFKMKELSARYSIPEFILHSWFSYYPKLQVNPIEIAESLLFASPLTIRTNTLNQPRELLIEKLKDEGFDCFPTKFSPFGITFSERINLTQHPLYRNGLIEIQDEGSQLICIACEPKNGQRILDACAGAGGKALLLALLQNDKGTIVANDINYLKLKELKKRASRAGFSSITTHLMNSKKTISLKKNYFDIVLVDAPCSGLGTARRNPMHKWWLTQEKLNRISRKQYQLLEFYSQFVRTGGILVYSTCSLMPEENQFVVDKFLSNNKHFIKQPLSPSFKKFSIDLPLLNEETNQITLFPHIHGTDGFFIAKFRKAS